MAHTFTHERYERTTIGRYINAIRNANKKAYAQEFWAWLDAGKIGPEPQRTDLSYMAAQAVRVNLYGFSNIERAAESDTERARR